MFLSFNQHSEVDPRHVIHEQTHRTTLFTRDAFRTRQSILRTNGERATWFAGAWLGNGLHEGAVESALRVSQALGGESL